MALDPPFVVQIERKQGGSYRPKRTAASCISA
jgi:hypothetical protein